MDMIYWYDIADMDMISWYDYADMDAEIWFEVQSQKNHILIHIENRTVNGAVAFMQYVVILNILKSSL